MIAEMEFQRFLALQDSLAGGIVYPFFLLLADRLERTVILCRPIPRRHHRLARGQPAVCDNVVYDEMNMNSFNFVNATFDDLFGRYPTEAEFEQAYAAVEFSAPSLLFGTLIEDKDSFRALLVEDQEFREKGAIRWWGERLLVRPITGAENGGLAGHRRTRRGHPNLQRLLITSDEYADFE